MSLWDSPLHSWFCRKSWSLEEKGDPNRPSGLRSVKAPVTQAATWPKCPEAARVDRRGSSTAGVRGAAGPPLPPWVGVHHPCTPVWNRRAISLCRIRSAVGSTPRGESLRQRATTWSQCSPNEPAVRTRCCFPHSLCGILSSESWGLSLPNSHLRWFYHWLLKFHVSLCAVSCWLGDTCFYN